MFIKTKSETTTKGVKQHVTGWEKVFPIHIVDNSHKENTNNSYKSIKVESSLDFAWSNSKDLNWNSIKKQYPNDQYTWKNAQFYLSLGWCMLKSQLEYIYSKNKKKFGVLFLNFSTATDPAGRTATYRINGSAF